MSRPPRIHCIVAYAANRVIGKNNQLPWHLPADLAHFKRTTMGHPVLMGRRTWESLGRALPGRRNLVVTRQSSYGDPDAAGAATSGAEIHPSLPAALASCAGQERVYIIGGSEIFRAALPLADEVIATEIHAQVDGDVFFPELDASIWQETSRQPQPEENGLRFDFVSYRRKASAAPALSHLGPSGQAQMVDVTPKPITGRSAVAQARITLGAAAWRLLNARDNDKGEVLNTARVAGILAAKRCDTLIPLCHSLPLSFVGMDFETDEASHSLLIRATCKTRAQTGVEMEALTACSVAALTVYDMCKAADKGMRIDDIRLIHKTGGKSGEWHASE